MTIRTPTYLKGVFETNDIPSGSDYADIFDSFLPITATGKQTLDISLAITGDFTASGDIYGQNLFGNVANLQRVSASVGNFDRVNTNVVSASGGEFNQINTQFVSASAANIKYLRGSIDTSIAAVGTATALARPVTETISFVKTVSSAQNDALIISRFRSGFVQYVINDASASARIFPTSASRFNQLSNGASFDIPDRRTLAIYHITSAQYITATFTR